MKISAHDVSTTLSSDAEMKVESERGDAASAFDSAPVKLDECYVTPVETHNPIELHATVAHWDGDSYTFYGNISGNLESSGHADADARPAEEEKVRSSRAIWARDSAASCGCGRIRCSPPLRRATQGAR